MHQTCKTCGRLWDYHAPEPECHDCRAIRVTRETSITRAVVNTCWTVAVLAMFAAIIYVIWTTITKF